MRVSRRSISILAAAVAVATGAVAASIVTNASADAAPPGDVWLVDSSQASLIVGFEDAETNGGTNNEDRSASGR